MNTYSNRPLLVAFTWPLETGDLMWDFVRWTYRLSLVGLAAASLWQWLRWQLETSRPQSLTEFGARNYLKSIGKGVVAGRKSFTECGWRAARRAFWFYVMFVGTVILISITWTM